MNAASLRSVVACFLVAASCAATRPASAESAFTPVAAGVRHRRIGGYDKARLATIFDRGRDMFLGGFDPSQGYMVIGAVVDSLGKKTPQFFVWGWSQGGWSTMQFLRRLETLGIPVTAAAPVSSPVVRRPITSPRPQDAAWIKGCVSNMIWSQEEYARLPGLAASAIKPEHLAASRKFSEGELPWSEYDAGKPGGVAGLLRPEFMASAVTGNARFWDLLEDAGAHRCKIKTLLRAYGGDADEATGERADHRASYVSATLQVKPWFDGSVTP